jgi:4-hydroxybenzoate polyprenyltransferase
MRCAGVYLAQPVVVPSKPKMSVARSPEVRPEALYVRTLSSMTSSPTAYGIDGVGTVVTSGRGRSTLAATVKALRFHQWAKNLLIFVPLVLSHRFFDPGVLTAGLRAFVAFGLCASAIYVINDLCDIEADRAHPRKRFRPFAAGDLTISTGVVLAAVLLTSAAALSLLSTPRQFALILLGYVAITSAYSWRLKREPVLDVFVLATLYVVRVLGGGAAAGITISNWLLGFALFLFLSLAFVKRYVELLGQNGHMPGRGYNAADHGWMLSIGTAAGYMSVVILALYVNSEEVARLYSSPRVLWLICPVLLYWVSRVWLRAGRQEVHDDPVLDALKDPASYLCALVALAILVFAL